MGLGGGYLRSSYEASYYEDATLKGGATALELMLGGTPAPGLAFGGALLIQQASDPNLEFANTRDEVNADFPLTIIAFFGNFYFDPTQGWYVQGLVGFGSGGLQGPGDDDDELGTGFAGGFGGGYDAWVSSQWSLGVELRLIAASLKYDRDAYEERYGVLLPSLLFAATYH